MVVEKIFLALVSLNNNFFRQSKFENFLLCELVGVVAHSCQKNPNLHTNSLKKLPHLVAKKNGNCQNKTDTFFTIFPYCETFLSRPHTQRKECAVKSVHACPKLNPYSLWVHTHYCHRLLLPRQLCSKRSLWWWPKRKFVWEQWRAPVLYSRGIFRKSDKIRPPLNFNRSMQRLVATHCELSHQRRFECARQKSRQSWFQDLNARATFFFTHTEF
jgi:hypothetical protein